VRPWLVVVLAVAVAGCTGAPADDGARQDADLPAEGAAPFDCPAASFRLGDVNVTITTDKGDITAVLYGARSPETVCNFLRYVEDDYYDGTVWHRVCAGFVIQMGGLDALGQEKPARPPIRNEAPDSRLRNVKGTLSMARETAPDSATTHVFVNLVDNTRLDFDGQYAPGYALFGNVTGGWDVVEDIADTPVVPSAQGCDGRPVPTTETTITRLRPQ
jgi:cyclophilin family peptidyl-prolyl cis-trans isomerase